MSCAASLASLALLTGGSLGCSGGKPGNGSDDEEPGLPLTALGEHALVFQRIDGGRATLSTPPLSTAATGSMLLVSVGRGAASAFSLPTDNKGNAAFTQLGVMHTYTRWPSSGTAVYALPNAVGGAGHVVSTSTPPSDEVTMSVVEVKGGRVVDFEWNEVLAGKPLTSLNVTTTGPATLVAFWWGDAGVQGKKTAVPDQGFLVIDSVLEEGALVQSATAIKQVPGAGEYNVTWVSTPQQGAQLWLVAIE